jgi:hypothetical protein
MCKILKQKECNDYIIAQGDGMDKGAPKLPQLVDCC